MNTKELKNKLMELKDRKFFLDMKDRWSIEDYRRMDKLNKEIMEIEKILLTM